MDVAELAEQGFHQEVLAAVDLAGPSPRARLLATFKRAFALLKTIPILQFFTRSDYELLSRRTSPEKLQEHLASDQAFFTELVARCRKAGVPIRVRPEEISRLFYPLVLAVFHGDELGQADLSGSTDVLLELAAAFCLGEVEIQSRAHPRRR
jgi:hypothetical protein